MNFYQNHSFACLKIYSGEFPVMWRNAIDTVEEAISTVGDIIKIVEDAKYCGGIPSMLWRIFNAGEGEHKHFADNTKSVCGFPPQYFIHFCSTNLYSSTILMVLSTVLKTHLVCF